MTRTLPKLQKAQSGFSLIELMVAVVLGLFLTLGVLQVYLGGKRTYNTQEGMSRLQENGRMGMYFLQRTIRQAGFYSTPGTDPAVVFTSGAPAVQGTDNANGDTITLRFQGGAGMTDCLGGNVAVDVTTTIVYSLSAADVNTGMRSLQCTVGGNTQPLIEGVTDLQIVYGLDTTLLDTNSTANQYLNATGIGANWVNVKSVRIILTVNSASNAGDENVGTQDFTSTIALRNRI